MANEDEEIEVEEGEDIEELEEDDPEDDALREAGEALLQAFHEFDDRLRAAYPHEWQRWKAGGKMVSDEFVGNYPTVRDFIE